jgi:hypothetical protein
MKKCGKKLSLLLILSLLVILTTQFTQAKAIDSSATDEVNLGQKIPLTNSEIEAAWPNLPTAKEIYSNDGCLVVDLRYCGKQVSSMNDELPDPNSPTVIDMASIIVNCTTSIPNSAHGVVMRNVPKIWLQYNSSLWVAVPPKYLTTPAMSAEMQQQGTTWAIGMYNNPTEIAGSAEVWGACTFGQFPANSFGSSGNYLCTDVLTISSSNNYYQLMTTLDPSGKSLVVNVYSRTTGDLIGYDQVYISAQTGVLYNQYIRYSTSGAPVQGWQFWWNFVLYFTWVSDTSMRMLKGYQANAVVESNDFNKQHFQGFSTTIGGRYYYQGANYPLAATAFLFNGNWVPSLPGQNAPAGRVYMGGTQLGTWGAVGGQAPPSNWGSLNIGIRSSAREIFTVGAGLPRPSHGSILWTFGPV